MRSFPVDPEGCLACREARPFRVAHSARKASLVAACVQVPGRKPFHSHAEGYVAVLLGVHSALQFVLYAERGMTVVQ